MPEGEDPIIVKPGRYPNPDKTKPELTGICLVIDDGGSWTIGKSEDGRFITVTIPIDAGFIVVHDPPEDETKKTKIAILRVNSDMIGVTGLTPTDKGEFKIAIAYGVRGST
jgi:hypothetical protein